MVEEIEIWRAANRLVKRHGEDAGIEAAKRVDAMLEDGDPNGAAVPTYKVMARTGGGYMAAHPAD